MDSNQSTTQADPHCDGPDGDVVVLAPKDWKGAEEALCKLAHVASEQPRAAGSNFSAGPRLTESALDATVRPTDLNFDPLPTDGPSLGRRASRSLARFLVTVGIGVAATLGWQSYGATAKQMIANWAPQLSWLLSPTATSRPSNREIAAEQPSPPAVEAVAPQATPAQAAAVAPTASEAAASTSPTAPSPELQQLETMAHDLTAVRQSVEQLSAVRQSVEKLTAGQEQMAREIAKLQAAGQDIRRRIALPPPAPARKPVPPPQPAPQASAPPQPAPQSSAAPLPPALPESPARPPMPVR
jgi:hypothetical protein